MGIVLLGHARVGMAQLLGDHAHRHAAHGEHRTVSVAEHAGLILAR
jgi:hypothetical protein